VTRGEIALLVPAGSDRLDPIRRELAARDWNVTVREPEEPALLRALARMREAPGPAPMRAAFARWHNRARCTAWAFEQRSRSAARALATVGGRTDLVLQVGGTSSPAGADRRTPYALYIDCTVRLRDGRRFGDVELGSSRRARRWYPLESRLYRDARLVFTASDYVRRSLVDDYGADPDRVVVVGEGGSFTNDERRARHYDGRTLLHVGREFEREGGEVLLRAFRHVATEIRGAELWIAGPRRLDRALPRGARLLGALSRRELAEAYARASIFVLPSWFQPFGLTLLEAMDHGLPCLGSNRCATPEIVAHGETGFVLPAGDVDALAGTAIGLLRRPKLMRWMGERGRRRVRERFSWPAVVDRIDAQLREHFGPAHGGQRNSISA
jgi:glycosyltransferase involved in cell wall biosynthesis